MLKAPSPVDTAMYRLKLDPKNPALSKISSKRVDSTCNEFDELLAVFKSDFVRLFIVVHKILIFDQ